MTKMIKELRRLRKQGKEERKSFKRFEWITLGYFVVMVVLSVPVTINALVSIWNFMYR